MGRCIRANYPDDNGVRLLNSLVVEPQELLEKGNKDQGAVKFHKRP